MPEVGPHGFSTRREDIFMPIFGAGAAKNKGLRTRVIHWSVKTLRFPEAPWAHHQRLINPTGDNR
ncbi:MAG: hypothetical protein KIT86_18695 [Hydrogenophaga sp.]|uniref:hypothetical protein n=1 Tax=Hydrogenophaga sp. TaxID=1904254 RepID=UPI0026063098|nr:hypothetical protein [Hydrogenophaga sp.]MCW5671688.1 hypothetical protein [Hydrogenophaga sp.]